MAAHAQSAWMIGPQVAASTFIKETSRQPTTPVENAHQAASALCTRQIRHQVAPRYIPYGVSKSEEDVRREAKNKNRPLNCVHRPATSSRHNNLGRMLPKRQSGERRQSARVRSSDDRMSRLTISGLSLPFGKAEETDEEYEAWDKDGRILKWLSEISLGRRGDVTYTTHVPC